MSILRTSRTIASTIAVVWLSFFGIAATAQEKGESTPLEMARSLEKEGKFDEAHPVLSGHLQVLLTTDPLDTLAIRESAWALSNNIDSNGRYDPESRTALRQSIELLQELPDRKLAQEIDIRRTLGKTYSWGGDMASSEEQLTIAHKLAIDHYGEEAIGTHAVHSLLANVWLQDNQMDRGIAAYQNMVASLTEQYGPDAAELTPYVTNLGLGYMWNADFLEAVYLNKRSIGIHKATGGEESPAMEVALGNLSIAYKMLGELADAREASETSLRLVESAKGRPEAIVPNLINVGTIQAELGDYEASLSTFQRAANIPNVDSSAKWRILHGLGITMSALGMKQEAEMSFLQALAIDSTQSIIRSLGDLYLSEGRLEESMEKFDFLLAGGIDPEGQAALFSRVAEVSIEMEDWPRAQKSIDAASTMLDSVYTAEHPDFAHLERLSSRIAASQGRNDQARRHATAAAELTDRFVEKTLPVLSFAEQKGVILDRIPKHVSTLLGTGNPDGFEGYGILVGWKGLLTHSLRSQRSYSRFADSSEHADTIAELASVRSKLGVLFRRANSSTKSDWVAQTDSLTASKEALERKLALAIGEMAESDPMRAAGIEGFRAALGESEVFVDIYRFADHLTRQGRYAAVLTSGSLSPRIISLGASDDVDALLSSWRRDILEMSDSEASFASLLETVWKPILDQIPDEVSRVWISPDAELSRLPWSEAAGPDGYAVSIIDDARSLILIKSDDNVRETSRTALLVGGINYLPAGLEALPGTISELNAIKEIGDDTGYSIAMLTDTLAARSNVLDAISESSVVHFATHGLFEGETRSGYLSRGTEPVDVPLSAGARRNPLLGSGLILSSSPGESDVLTAEDLVGLNMNSEIVVLSACDTGRGEEITGQGVQGLRSALFAAGARSILMSLWKVPDEPTSLLMTSFYQGIWQEGLSKNESLRRAKETVRSQFPEPVNWAAWVLAGDVW